MSQCPFWSTSDQKVNCYKECPFFIQKESIDEQDECPFKLLDVKHNFKIKDLLEYDIDKISNEEDDFRDMAW